MKADRTSSVIPGGESTSKERQGRSFARLVLVVSAILVFPLLVTIAYFATRNLLPRLEGFSLPAPPMANATGPTAILSRLFPESVPPSAASYSGLTFLELTYAAVLLVMSLLIVVLVLNRGLFSVRRIQVKRIRTSPFDEKEEDVIVEERHEVAAILDAAAARLTMNSGYRETVLRCYKMISEVLEKRSAVDGRVLTAREFEKDVSEKLKFDSPELSKATGLFEVARYSTDEITKQQAQEASECFSNLSSSLKNTAVPPDL